MERIFLFDLTEVDVLQAVSSRIHRINTNGPMPGRRRRTGRKAEGNDGLVVPQMEMSVDQWFAHQAGAKVDPEKFGDVAYPRAVEL